VAYPRTPTYRKVRPPLGDDQPRHSDRPRQPPLSSDNPPLSSDNPLWVTAYSINLTGYSPGLLHAWLRLNTGTWLAECSCIVHSPNKQARHHLRQWVPTSAITPRTRATNGNHAELFSST